jgi:hypothetical protein
MNRNQSSDPIVRIDRKGRQECIRSELIPPITIYTDPNARGEISEAKQGTSLDSWYIVLVTRGTSPNQQLGAKLSALRKDPKQCKAMRQ